MKIYILAEVRQIYFYFLSNLNFTIFQIFFNQINSLTEHKTAIQICSTVKKKKILYLQDKMFSF